MSQLFKVIIVDNLNRDYKPQGLVTMAMAESSAIKIAKLINTHSNGYENCAIVVPAEQPLNISSQYDLIDEPMPYEEWLMLTGATALPKQPRRQQRHPRTSPGPRAGRREP